MADITFDELEQALGRAQTPIAAAEAHGIICGSLCGPTHAGAWQSLILGREIASDAEEARNTLAAVYEQTRAWLDANEMGLQLYVPDDQRTLDERAEAVADWCRGFVLGINASGVKHLEQLPEDAREVLRDFAAISELRVETPADEEQEQALAEIEEYMRVGVQLVSS